MMSPVEIIRAAMASELVNEDGEAWEIKLLPGLTAAEIQAFETSLGFELPPATRELLEFTNGFEDGPLVLVDFSAADEYVGIDGSEFGWKTLGMAADGCGNLWGYALSRDSTDLGPIYYFCHDAPVFLYQSPDLAHFLTELFAWCRPPFKSLVDDVHADRLKEVWLENPDLIAVEDARLMPDAVVADFARTLPDGWQVIDLRTPEIGAGFSWGRCEEFRRHPDAMIFGLKFKPPGWFARLLRRIRG